MKKGLLCLLCLALVFCILHGCKILRPAATHELAADSAIASEVRGRIAHAGLPPVRVFVLDGRVTLSGSVSSQETKEKIIAVAKDVKGVLLVTPDLQLQKIR
jgi:osmotically-inducible protein OsmY